MNDHSENDRRQSDTARVLGVIVLVALAGVNALQFPWTLNLILEQITFGWGFGTTMELAMLFPWIAELLSLPVAVFSVVVLCLPSLRPADRPVRAAMAILLALSVVQTVLTNLFAFF